MMIGSGHEHLRRAALAAQWAEYARLTGLAFAKLTNNRAEWEAALAARPRPINVQTANMAAEERGAR